MDFDDLISASRMDKELKKKIVLLSHLVLDLYILFSLNSHLSLFVCLQVVSFKIEQFFFI